MECSSNPEEKTKDHSFKLKLGAKELNIYDIIINIKIDSRRRIFAQTR